MRLKVYKVSERSFGEKFSEETFFFFFLEKSVVLLRFLTFLFLGAMLGIEGQTWATCLASCKAAALGGSLPPSDLESAKFSSLMLGDTEDWSLVYKWESKANWGLYSELDPEILRKSEDLNNCFVEFRVASPGFRGKGCRSFPLGRERRGECQAGVGLSRILSIGPAGGYRDPNREKLEEGQLGA